VLEVGLGGRLDATNVADAAAVAITSIARDHEQQLGSSLEQIAFEKAGVIKPDRPVVLGEIERAPRDVIVRVAAERGAPLLDATAEGGCLAAYDSRRSLLELSTPVRHYPATVLGLPGRHQVGNALVAVRLLEAIDAAGIPVGPRAILAGIRDVRWPGRLEWVEIEGGSVLLDAAHNPAGARSLAEYLEDPVMERLPLVFGVAKDKDVRGMLEVLAPAVSRVVATQASTPRALDAEDVAARVREVAPSLPAIAIRDPLDACREALSGSRRAVVAGSIFLIGEVRARAAK
jgi:dihydrofolate synthase/folylpolyglutamate synthase